MSVGGGGGGGECDSYPKSAILTLFLIGFERFLRTNYYN